MEEARQIEMMDIYNNAFTEPKSFTPDYINDIFRGPQAPAAPKSKKKDVKVTRNKSGGDRCVIRFGLIGRAAEEARKHAYITPSFIEMERRRIYFKFSDTKDGKRTYKICKSADGGGYYFTFTPSEEADRLYQKLYVGKAYNIMHCDVSGCFYITNEEE